MYKSELEEYFKKVAESQSDPSVPKPEPIKVIDICEERGDCRQEISESVRIPMGRLLKNVIDGRADFSSRERVVLTSGGDERARIAADYLSRRGYRVEPLE